MNILLTSKFSTYFKWTLVLCGINHIVWPIKTIESVLIREIIRMKHKGFSNSKISQSLSKSRTTILKYLSVIEVSSLKTKALLKLSKEGFV